MGLGWSVPLGMERPQPSESLALRLHVMAWAA